MKKPGRREFLKALTFLGGLVLISFFVPSCLRKEEATMTKISLVRTADRTEGTRQAIELLGTNPVKGKSVVLKPNFNTADAAPGTVLIVCEDSVEPCVQSKQSSQGILL